LPTAGPAFTPGRDTANTDCLAFHQPRSRGFPSLQHRAVTMSQNYYSEIYLHLVWHTKTSAPLLTESIEPLAWNAIQQKADQFNGVEIHAIGGTDTHVHVALSIPPTLTISDVIGQLKGYSAHEVNRRAGLKQKVVQWQSGYGVVSFGAKDLPWVAEYIRNQKEHHAVGKTFQRLEDIGEDQTG
jgi:putative transposase